MTEPTIQCPNCKTEIKLTESTAGVYGDLQGIAGRTLPEIDGLDVKLLSDGK